MRQLLYFLFIQLFASGISLAKGGPRDTVKLKPVEQMMIVTKAQLFHLVDSLLDLDTVDVHEIELVNYYNSMLSAPHVNGQFMIARNNALPAVNFYEGFDETVCFQITPEEQLSEQQVLQLTGDSLGAYHHPWGGPITSKFGWRDGRMHKGMDIDLDRGDSVVAAFDGMVRFAQNKGGFGNVVIIRHYNGLETVYAHLSRIKVKPGQCVSSGQLIGLGGSTGHSSGPHLHFEMRFKGHALNPGNLVSFSEQKLLHDTIMVRRTRYGVCAYPSNATLHTVERGDSWYEIAKRYGLSMKELCALNGTDRRYYLKVGQKLRIN